MSQYFGASLYEVSDERLQMAELDFLSLSMLFDHMLTTCKNKCIPPRYGEEDLTKGESVCIDRCVSKYFKANLKVGEYMRSTQSGPESLTYRYNSGA